MIAWDWRAFEHLSTDQLYDILSARHKVSIVGPSEGTEVRTGLGFLVLASLLYAKHEVNYAQAFAYICTIQETASIIDIDDLGSVKDQIVVADSLVTLDPFPYYWDAGEWRMYFDESEDQTEISIYRAIFLRPIRTIWNREVENLPRPENPRGILFFSKPEEGALIAELFPFNEGLFSYEEYYTSTPSLKILLRLDSLGTIVGARFIRLLR